MTKKIIFSFFLIIAFYFFILTFPVLAQSPKIPTLSIASPKEGTTILGDHFTFSFVVGDFSFENGLLLVWLDEKNPDLGNANEVISSYDSTFKNISPGNHTLLVEVVKKDRSSFKPPIKSQIHFTTRLPSTITPSPTPPPLLKTVIQKITKEQIMAIDGLVLLIIGFSIFIIYGRRKLQ